MNRRNLLLPTKNMTLSTFVLNPSLYTHFISSSLMAVCFTKRKLKDFNLDDNRSLSNDGSMGVYGVRMYVRTYALTYIRMYVCDDYTVTTISQGEKPGQTSHSICRCTTFDAGTLLWVNRGQIVKISRREDWTILTVCRSTTILLMFVTIKGFPTCPWYGYSWVT